MGLFSTRAVVASFFTFQLVPTAEALDARAPPVIRLFIRRRASFF